MQNVTEKQVNYKQSDIKKKKNKSSSNLMKAFIYLCLILFIIH